MLQLRLRAGYIVWLQPSFHWGALALLLQMEVLHLSHNRIEPLRACELGGVDTTKDCRQAATGEHSHSCCKWRYHALDAADPNPSECSNFGRSEPQPHSRRRRQKRTLRNPREKKETLDLNGTPSKEERALQCGINPPLLSS